MLSRRNRLQELSRCLVDRHWKSHELLRAPSKVFLKTLRIDEQSLNIDSYFFHCAITLPSINVFKEKLLNRLILRDKLFKKLCGYYPIKYANICFSISVVIGNVKTYLITRLFPGSMPLFFKNV